MLHKLLKLALLPILHTVATYLLTCKHMCPLSQTSSVSPHYLPCRIKSKDPSRSGIVYYMFGLIYLFNLYPHKLRSNSTILLAPWTLCSLMPLYTGNAIFILWNALTCFFLQKALLKGIFVCRFFPQLLGSHVTLSSIPYCILHVL